MRTLPLVLVVLFASGAGAVGLQAPAPPGCGYVAGLGEACAVEGGYEVVLPDGRRVFTHGPDPLQASDFTTSALAPERAPPCVADPGRDYHAHFIYAHPVSRPDRSAQLTPSLRSLIREANGLLHLEGSLRGAPVQYRFRCDPDGQPTVSVVTLPLATGAGDYRTVVSLLSAMGFVSGHAKYWVWYDDQASCTCGGVASAPLDTDRSPANLANVGGQFGVTYGHMSVRILMHENAHTLGAVSDQAPASSGAGHCNDGLDILCYADGGPNSSYTQTRCRDRQHFDCGADTYFHPDPPPGSFVALRWQLGAPVNRFVQGCHYVEGDLLLQGEQAQVPVPAACAGHLYAIYGRTYGEPAHAVTGGPPLRVTFNVFSLCWHAGETVLACPAQKPWGHEGRVPAGATHAVVTRASDGDDPRFTLSVI